MPHFLDRLLGLELVRAVTDAKQRVPVKDDVLTFFLEFGRDITKDMEIDRTEKAEVGGELSAFVAKLSSKLGTEDVTRTAVRERLSHRLSDLLERIDVLAREVEHHTGQRTLVAIEDLDKTDLGTAKALFYSHATSLTEPPIAVIYTFPIALRHDNDFSHIRMNFPDPFVLPNLKVRSQAGTPDEEGLARLRQIITNRMDASLITEGALTTIAKLSGGIPRELITLGRLACLEALVSGHERIDEEVVDAAAWRKRRDYQVLLTSQQLDLLRQVRKTKRVENEQEYRDLLHNLSVLEYRNHQAWYDVHPLIEALLDDEA